MLDRCVSSVSVKPATPPAATWEKHKREGEKRNRQQNKNHNHHSTPPSMDASWRPPRLIWELPIKVREQNRVQNESLANPRPLLRTVPLPVHKVLKTAAPPAHIQQAADCECGVTFDEPGGWRGARLVGSEGSSWQVWAEIHGRQDELLEQGGSLSLTTLGLMMRSMM